MFVCGIEGKEYWNEDVTTGAQAVQFIKTKEELTPEVYLMQNGIIIDHLEESLESSATIQILPCGGLRGGKGGFGSMLRSIGAQIERTTNHEAMRDLSGRRQRDVNNERRLKDYISGQAEREKDAEEKKEKKLEKLRRIATGENKSKHDFSDPVYDKARSETEEKIHEAVEAALAVKPIADNKKELKRKSDEAGPAPKKKGLWLGDGLDGLDELDDSDLTDSDEEKEPEKEKAVAQK